MSRIRGKDTKPEHRLRRALWAAGLRYRKHARTRAGRPDIVFPGPRVAVFVDGCFWHGCPDHYVRPRTRAGFWAEKLRANTARDRRQTLELESADWLVMRVWECELHEQHDVDAVVTDVRRAVRDGVRSPAARWVVVRVESDANDHEARHEELLRDPSSHRCVHRVRQTRKRKRQD
jgi:DNA mismatch endonuclease (patch repair protein)